MRDIRVYTNIPRTERCWRQCAGSVLRWEQLHARKGDSLTLPTNTFGCATLLTEELTESPKVTERRTASL